MRLASFALAAGLAAPLVPALAADAPPRLGFPLACQIGRDCEVQHYVNRDPEPGVRDYHCGPRTYDKHDGIDIRLSDMAEQRRGVDVLAAAAGRVVAVRDGVPDISIRAPGAPSVAGHECGNRVGIEHGGGWLTDYCHLAKGSLKVKVGEAVAAGQPIAKVGLSGDTEFPHLHISLRHGTQVVDPFSPDMASSACGAQAPLWTPAAQAAMVYKWGAILNAGFAPGPVTNEAIEAGGMGPVTAASPALIAYVRAIGLDPGDVIRIAIAGPDGKPLADHADPPLAHYRDQQFLMVGRKAPPGGWAKGTYTAEARIERPNQPPIVQRFTVRL